MAYETVIAATTGLVSYWRLNENAGTTGADSFGASPLTYVGTPTLGVTGPIISTADKDSVGVAAGKYCQVARSTAIDTALGSPSSFEMWFKRTRTNVIEQLFMKGSGELSARFENLAQGNQDKIVVRCQNVGILATSSIAIADTNWHHLVISEPAAGATPSIYIDSFDRTSATSARTFAADTATDLFIGADSAGITGFIGTIDEVAVYSSALSAATANAHYVAAGIAPTGGDVAAPASVGGGASRIGVPGFAVVGR